MSLAALHAVERDAVGRRVGPRPGVGEVVAERRHAEHAPAGGHEPVAAQAVPAWKTATRPLGSDASAASQPVIGRRTRRARG